MCALLLQQASTPGWPVAMPWQLRTPPPSEFQETVQGAICTIDFDF